MKKKTRLSPMHATVLIGAVVILALVVLAYFVGVAPRMSKVDDLNAQADSLESSNAATEGTIRDLEQKHEGLDAEVERAAALSKRFPSSAAQAELFADFRAAAISAGLEEDAVQSLTPSVPAAGSTGGGAAALPGQQAAGGQIATMTLGVTAAGPWDKLQAFLRNLENMDRAYKIDTVSMAPGEGVYTLTLNGTLYMMPSLTPPDA